VNAKRLRFLARRNAAGHPPRSCSHDAPATPCDAALLATEVARIRAWTDFASDLLDAHIWGFCPGDWQVAEGLAHALEGTDWPPDWKRDRDDAARINPAGIAICRGSAASRDEVSFPVEDGVDLQLTSKRLDVLPQGGQVDVGPPFELRDIALAPIEAGRELHLGDPAFGADPGETQGVAQCSPSVGGRLFLVSGNQPTPNLGPLRRRHQVTSTASMIDRVGRLGYCGNVRMKASTCSVTSGDRDAVTVSSLRDI